MAPSGAPRPALRGEPYLTRLERDMAMVAKCTVGETGVSPQPGGRRDLTLNLRSPCGSHKRFFLAIQVAVSGFSDLGRSVDRDSALEHHIDGRASGEVDLPSASQ